MPRKMSNTEIRASRLIDQIACSNILPNDGSANARKLFLTESQLGVSVIRDGRLYLDDPKTKRPKCYTSMTPDYSWNLDFIEVKDDISGASWHSINRDSLNDQIRASLFRARICDIEEMRPQSFDCLSSEEKEIATASLLNFPSSNPERRLYIRWEQLLAAIESPEDNFVKVVVNIESTQLPLKLLNLPNALETTRLYMLDNSIMNEWEILVQ